MESLLEKTSALRSEAWAQLMCSAHFSAFRALDNAVVALGGESAMPSNLAKSTNGSGAARGEEVAPRIKTDAARRLATLKRISHGDAAYKALREAGEPLQVGPFMEAAKAKGAKLTGVDPLSNFRSAISKDKRFRSIMRNGLYYWWFTKSPFPQKWDEAGAADLLTAAPASDASSQEGGESHAAATVT